MNCASPLISDHHLGEAADVGFIERRVRLRPGCRKDSAGSGKWRSASARAVSAFSPPESSGTFCRRFPGGWAAMSMPGFAGSIRLGEPHLAGAAAEERLEGARQSEC